MPFAALQPMQAVTREINILQHVRGIQGGKLQS